MFGEGVRTLAEAGALRDGYDHLATVFVGPQSLYDWAVDRPDLCLAGCEHTHDPASLAAVDGLITVNSALEVDRSVRRHAGDVRRGGRTGHERRHDRQHGRDRKSTRLNSSH